MGGTGALVNALVRLIEELGGQIHLNTEVSEILVEGRRATGVRLADGSVHKAGYVISNADTANTYLKLIKPEHRLQYSAFSVEPVFRPSAWFCPHNRSEDIDNLILVGAGTHPGAGLPGVPPSSKIAENLIVAGMAARPQHRRRAAMTDPTQAPEPRIRLGISACLLGWQVRYDGGHKLDHFLVDELGRYVEWVPVCPEVECGLPVPREAMHLVGDPESPHLVTIKTGIDLTDQMTAWAKNRVEALAAEGLHGFVFKKDSPSSGLFRVKVYNERGMAERVGVGLFAREVKRRFPLLPLEEEGRLNDTHLRENFIDRIFTYQRWTETQQVNPTPGGLVKFHTAHKMTLLAHSPAHYRKLGYLVAQIGQRPLDQIVQEYGMLLMEGLKAIATPGRHTNVLQHLLGFMKDDLDAGDKAELLESMDTYRAGLVPLIVPITLLKHHIRRLSLPEWVHQQVYLNPYPKELMLRNRV